MPALFFRWFTVEHVWLAVGFAGQALFAARFILQWFRSEMAGRSVIPVGFWYCSAAGGAVMLAYAIYRNDPVFITGQATGLLVYGRNLYLIFRERAQLRAVASGPGEPVA